MTIVEAQPIACTLAPGARKDRMASLAALNGDALRAYQRRDLVLELNYAPKARERVREMIRSEQICCAFLSFELREGKDEIRVTVTAPERAREAADALFDHFLAKAPAAAACACGSASPAVKNAAAEPPGAKAASVTAMTLSTGAIACGACCILPFTLPATILAGTGSALAWFVHMHLWVTILALIAVVGAWGWIAWQVRRTQRRPALATLIMMTSSSIFSTVAVLWPLIEKPIIRALRA